MVNWLGLCTFTAQIWDSLYTSLCLTVFSQCLMEIAFKISNGVGQHGSLHPWLCFVDCLVSCSFISFRPSLKLQYGLEKMYLQKRRKRPIRGYGAILSGEEYHFSQNKLDQWLMNGPLLSNNCLIRIRNHVLKDPLHSIKWCWRLCGMVILLSWSWVFIGIEQALW